MKRWLVGGIAAIAAVFASAAYAQTIPASADVKVGGFDFGSPETVTEGVDMPWGMNFLPNGDALFTQRDTAEILRVAPGGEPEVITQIDEAAPDGEGGLLGLAVSPTYQDDGLIYIYYTSDSDNRIAKLTLDNLEPEVILDGIPSASIHNGGRIQFGPDGKLYATTGDASNGDNSQDPDSLGGKILRINPDGSVPDDNPTAGSPVYTMGHRNVQGIAWAEDGEAYASEFGQDTWDEANHIVAGQNYGWPECEGPCDNPDYTEPIAWWATSEASPSGAAVVGDVLFIAAQQGQRLWMVPLGGGDPTHVLEGEYGRIRTVELGPDGYLWIATSNGGGGDSIVRFPPE